MQVACLDGDEQLRWAGGLARAISHCGGGEMVVRQRAVELSAASFQAHGAAMAAHDAAQRAAAQDGAHAALEQAQEQLGAAWVEAEGIETELAAVMHAETEAKKAAAREAAQKATLGFKGKLGAQGGSNRDALNDRARHVRHTAALHR